MKVLPILLSSMLAIAPVLTPAYADHRFSINGSNSANSPKSSDADSRSSWKAQTDARSADAKITHVLNRLTFGPRPGDIDKVRSIGLEKFINNQLNPSSLAESPIVIEQLEKTASLRTAPSSQLLAEFRDERMRSKAAKRENLSFNNQSKTASNRFNDVRGTAGLNEESGSNSVNGNSTDAGTAMERSPGSGDQVAMQFGNGQQNGFQQQQKSFGKRMKRKRAFADGFRTDREQNNFAQNAQPPRGRMDEDMNKFRRAVESQTLDDKLVRAIESPRQLNELLCDFWFNHFNICSTKGVDRVLVGVYEEQAIRPYVLGNFRDMLGATMHHPAMMFYLDNAQNTKDGFQANNPKNKRRGINENYARELMELHTLGVDGGYTQHDVAELARVLTGWGMPPLRDQQSGFSAYFEDRRHDYGDKVVLGTTIKGTGASEIEQVLDMLAKHPSTAHHISYQLAQYFVDDNPPEALVQRLSKTYMQSNGNIKAMLKTMFNSSEFWDPKYQSSKFKSPFLYTVSAFRATGQHVTDPKLLQAFLRIQGQPLYACLTPDGYKNTKEAWLNADGLLQRIDFATRLTRRRRGDVDFDYKQVEGTVNGGMLSEKTRKAVEAAPEAQRVAALISSPEFMRY